MRYCWSLYNRLVCMGVSSRGICNARREKTTRALLPAHQSCQTPKVVPASEIVARHDGLAIQSGACKVHIADDGHGPFDITIEQGIQLRRICVRAPLALTELQQGVQWCRVVERYLAQRTKHGGYLLTVVVDDAVDIGEVQATGYFGMRVLAGITNTCKYF